MKESVGETEMVKAQGMLFADFRQQLIDQAVRYHQQGKFGLEKILREVLQSN